MGPSCGGFTCNLAPFRLLSTIQDTRSDTPCANSGVSTPGETFRMGVGVASVALVVLELNCAAPAVPSLEASGSEESPFPLRECLSPALTSPSAKAVCALATAAGLEAGTVTGGAKTAAAPAPWAALAVAGVSESSDDDDESGSPRKLV